eukprot:CAMPEP_0167827312 /NCGR_PEP_ID=MMETSP0112_2-20121227/10612_1 /TAXON_ID=91324 /ORGANISM="Lotharella globosa, Strain CCCM811" /LENGTH=34 /DNA_ID= /DNA_START= /DNA_END= /DNA_ORIENTATION=
MTDGRLCEPSFGLSMPVGLPRPPGLPTTSSTSSA